MIHDVKQVLYTCVIYVCINILYIIQVIDIISKIIIDCTNDNFWDINVICKSIIEVLFLSRYLSDAVCTPAWRLQFVDL